MKKKYLLVASAITTLLLSSQITFASSFGTNITVFDGKDNPNGDGQGYENNEAEPGMVQSQKWDLEGLFIDYDQKTLTMVGGYDFINGRYSGDSSIGTFYSGDIFIDTDGDYGTSTPLSTSNGGSWDLGDRNGYEYALDISWNRYDGTLGNFNLMELTDETITQNVYYDKNETGPTPTSNPYRYDSKGELKGSGSMITSGSFLGDYYNGEYLFSDWTSGDDSHYFVTFDLTSLFNTLSLNDIEALTFHFTMGCGNDNLIGQWDIPNDPVPEPATMLLFGTGLAGLAGMSRRRKK